MQRAYQSRWWDGIVAAIEGTGDVHADDVTAYETREWASAQDADLLAVARTAQEGTNMYRMNNLFTVDEHAARIAALEKELRKARAEAETLRGELRGADQRIAELRHRMRPPGAALRDRLRRRFGGRSE